MVGAVPEASVQVGSLTMIVSPCARGAEHWNVSTAARAAATTGVLTANDVPEKEATTVAVDVVIAVAGAFVAAAMVAAMVRVAWFAACAAAATPVVMSALVVMVHGKAAASVAVATVNVTAALSVPLFATAAVNVLVPHP